MIEKKRKSREELMSIGSLCLLPNSQTDLILYDIYDNGIDFVEIWIPTTAFFRLTRRKE